MKIKLRKSDKIYTKIQRLRFDYTCQKCGKRYDGSKPLYNLGVSHYYGRSRESTRFDDDNVTLLCNMPCHRKWEGIERSDYTEYMIERLGQKGYDALKLKSNSYKKRDDKETERILMKRLEGIDES